MITLPILATSLIHFLLKCWENVLFELRSERVKADYSLMLWNLLSLLAQASSLADQANFLGHTAKPFVDQQVDDALNEEPSYFGCGLRKFRWVSPGPVVVDSRLKPIVTYLYSSGFFSSRPSNLNLVVAEVLVRGFENSTDRLAALMSSKVRNLTGVVDPNYFKYEDRGNDNSQSS